MNCGSLPVSWPTQWLCRKAAFPCSRHGSSWKGSSSSCVNTKISGVQETLGFLADPLWWTQVIFLFSWRRSHLFLFNQLLCCVWWLIYGFNHHVWPPHHPTVPLHLKGGILCSKDDMKMSPYCSTILLLVHLSPIPAAKCKDSRQNKTCSRHYFVSWKLSFAQIRISQTPPNFRSEEWA